MIFGMSKVPRWVEIWGPVAVMLAVMGGMFAWGFTVLRSDIARVENSLTVRIERLEATVAENGKAIARLEVRMQRVEDDVTWLRNNARGDR